MSLAMLAHEGVEAVVVLGHADYYPRFGFSADLASKLDTPFNGPHLMAMELEPGAIEGLAARPLRPRVRRVDRRSSPLSTTHRIPLSTSTRPPQAGTEEFTMFRPIAITLATILCLPAAEVAKPDIRAIALEIPSGVPVRIKTTYKKTVQGKLTAVTSDGVTLQVVDKDQITERTVPFAQMKSIKQTNKPMSAGAVVLIALGVFYLIGIIVVGIGLGFSA